MVRKFKIINEKYNELQAYLYYDTEKEWFNIEMLDDYTGMHPDVFFDVAVNELGKKWLGIDMSNKYVEARVIPPNRHAIGHILAEMGLDKYSVIGQLDVTKGHCQMDFSYFEEVTDINKNMAFPMDGD